MVLKLRKPPDQVVRLTVLAVLAVVALLAVRSRFVPPDFGEKGHYRTGAVQLAADLPIRHAGWQACVECHTEEGELRAASYHRTLSCEVCHGAAAAHAEDPAAMTPRVPRGRGEGCMYCHEYLPARPTGFPQIVERLHNPTEACIHCHDPHDPTPPSTPEQCSACHGHIARIKAISPHAALACERCHETPPAHLVDPRANLPAKPRERQFCGSCHAEGAAASAAIPRVALADHGGSYLCWQCHYPHFPEG
jgi:hypothetical protein